MQIIGKLGKMLKIMNFLKIHAFFIIRCNTCNLSDTKIFYFLKKGNHIDKKKHVCQDLP